RVKLFNKYCLPSILAQTSKSFRWLIYFDPASPAWLLDLIKEHQAKGYYVAKFREEVPREILMADMAGLFPDRHAILLTTSLDNDDALAIDFVARLQSSLQTHGAFVYFFENGVIKSPKGVFERYDPNNAFPSIKTVGIQLYQVSALNDVNARSCYEVDPGIDARLARREYGTDRSIDAIGANFQYRSVPQARRTALLQNGSKLKLFRVRHPSSISSPVPPPTSNVGIESISSLNPKSL
ncbi:glycosyltransferase, partial [Aerococcus mictus]|uniref:glycosyltransferase n=1 Tax=Aerococcus mictus TaxID=2976810 RepID=UPI002FCEFB09